MYSDVVTEPEEKNVKPYMEQENENQLYETADMADADGAVFNPIYDRFVFLTDNFSCCFDAVVRCY